MIVKIFLSVFVFLGAYCTTALPPAGAEDFYKGKTIHFIVGAAAGGGYDTYTRAVARHIGKHIPGHPTSVVQNMTGAGTLIAAHHLYHKAAPDGLTLGAWNSGQVLRQALDDRAVKFKADKFGWIGAPVRGMPSCGVMGHAGVKTLDDVLKSKKRIKIGSTRAGTTTDDLPRLLNLTLGTNFDVIPGYTGTSRIRIAMQKKEVDGVCFGWESMRVTATSMLRAEGDEKFIPFITHGHPEDPEVKGLPELTEVVKGKNLAIVKAWVSQYDFQRPLSLPPGTPKDRIATLRAAYKATLEDPEFLAEAKRSKLIIDYVSGEAIEKIVHEILTISPDAKASLQKLGVKTKKTN
jgi:tripartite-type tricarboxylate transporter receptor subunit TctC